MGLRSGGRNMTVQKRKPGRTLTLCILILMIAIFLMKKKKLDRKKMYMAKSISNLWVF